MSTADAKTSPQRKASPKKPKAPPRKVSARSRARAKQRDRGKKLAKQAEFLGEYARLVVIGTACEAVGIDRRQHYRWMEDPAYKARFDEAHKLGCDRLVREALRRGLEGVDEPVFGKLPGKDSGSGVVGTIRKYSDRLLELLLKAKLPSEFRERISIGGDPDAPPVRSEDMTPARAAELYRSKLKRA